MENCLLVSGKVPQTDPELVKESKADNNFGVTGKTSLIDVLFFFFFSTVNAHRRSPPWSSPVPRPVRRRQRPSHRLSSASEARNYWTTAKLV